MKYLWIFLILLTTCTAKNSRQKKTGTIEMAVSAKESEFHTEYTEYIEELKYDISELNNGNYEVLAKYFTRENLQADRILTNVIINMTGGQKKDIIEEIPLKNAGKISSWRNQYGALFLNDEELLISLKEWESLPMTCKKFQEKLRSFYSETDNKILQSRIEEFFGLDWRNIYINFAAPPHDYGGCPEEIYILYDIIKDAFNQKTDLYDYIMNRLILPQDPIKLRIALLNMIAFSFSAGDYERKVEGTVVRWYLSSDRCPEIND